MALGTGLLCSLFLPGVNDALSVLYAGDLSPLCLRYNVGSFVTVIFAIFINILWCIRFNVIYYPVMRIIIANLIYHVNE